MKKINTSVNFFSVLSALLSVILQFGFTGYRFLIIFAKNPMCEIEKKIKNNFMQMGLIITHTSVTCKLWHCNPHHHWVTDFQNICNLSVTCNLI